MKKKAKLLSLSLLLICLSLGIGFASGLHTALLKNSQGNYTLRPGDQSTDVGDITKGGWAGP